MQQFNRVSGTEMTFRTKEVLGIALISILLSAVMGYAGTSQGRMTESALLRDQARLLSRQVGTLLKTGISGHDQELLGYLVRQVMKCSG